MPWVAPSAPEVLSRLPLFSQVAPDLLVGLSSAVQQVRLGRGDVLFHQGQPCTGFFVVLRGQMKLAITSAEGQEKVLEIIGPGESFAEAALFAGRPYPVASTALVATDLLAIPGQPIFELIDGDPLLARRMLAGLSIRLHTLVADLGSLALHTGTQRVIGFLLGEVRPTDDESGSAGGAARVRLPVGKAVLASRLNLTPETFSRVLRLLAEQGLVTVEGRDVALHDLARLAEYSGT
jgi:CRP/FNR family transcriptional regulator, dissimilatory nitrate respiration regulator